MKEQKTFLHATFLLFFFPPLTKSQRVTRTRKNFDFDFSAMCELDSVALHHKGSSGRQRLARPMPFKISISGNLCVLITE